MFYKSRRLRFVFSVLALYFITLVVLRLAFYLAFYPVSSDLFGADIVRAFWIGIRFDFRLAMLLTLPLMLLGMVPYANLVQAKLTRHIGKGYFVAICLGVLMFYIFDFAHYDYLGGRIDASVARFAANPLISGQMIWESYPVITVLLGWLLLTALLTAAYGKITGLTLEQPAHLFPRWQKLVYSLLAGLLLFVGSWGTLSQYPLRWSNAFFTRDAFISALGLNPVLYYVETIKNRKIDFDVQQVSKYYPDIAEYLGVADTSVQDLNFSRVGGHSSANATGSHTTPVRPNIVIILLESVGNNRLGVSGNVLDPTPNLDQLVREGTYFSRFYVPKVGTARSVFALITGIPDVTHVRTSSRNPLIAEQYTIINEFKDYRKLYIIGGSTSWANIRGLLQHNIPDIEIIEQEDFDRPRIDVWGISDLDLFKEVHQIFEQLDTSRPFFAIVQTAANHAPYTIPDDNDGFEIVSPPDSQITQSGFKSVAQYNAMRLLDHSIGEFFQYAAQAEYFANTIFVLFGDHGTSDPWATHMPISDYAFRFRSYNVPLIIYSPTLLPDPVIDSTVATLPDIMPTIAELAGIEYRNKTLGCDILDDKSGRENYAQLARGNRIGLVSDKYYIQMDTDGTNMSFHEILSPTPDIDIQDAFPVQAARMNHMSRGFYETAKYMLYNNKN